MIVIPTYIYEEHRANRIANLHNFDFYVDHLGFLTTRGQIKNETRIATKQEIILWQSVREHTSKAVSTEEIEKILDLANGSVYLNILDLNILYFSEHFILAPKEELAGTYKTLQIYSSKDIPRGYLSYKEKFTCFDLIPIGV